MAAPKYYERTIKGVQIQVSDITHAWNLDSDEAQAVQYILRGKFKNEGKDELREKKQIGIGRKMSGGKVTRVFLRQSETSQDVAFKFK